MCPLRLILIFLSATLAGFFVLRGIRSQPDEEPAKIAASEESLSFSRKIRSGMSLGFWGFVDMASGRYLWRNLVGSSDSEKEI